MKQRTSTTKNWFKTAIKKKCKGWIAVRLKQGISSRIQKWGKENIPDEELNADGREDNAHITIIYGLCADQKDTIKTIVKNSGPVKVTLKKIGYFTNNPDFDVVIVKVESRDLEKLNEKLCRALNVESDYIDYKAHCTVAYVKKGKATKHGGNTEFDGTKLKFNKIVFINNNDKEVTIELV